MNALRSSLLFPALAACLLTGGCNERQDSAATGESSAPATAALIPLVAIPLTASPANSGAPELQAVIDGEPWTASSIRYHVDHAFDAKEYAHTFEARGGDGSQLVIAIVVNELTLAPREYAPSADDVTIRFTPSGRSAGSYVAETAGRASVTVTSERESPTVSGTFSATLEDLDPTGEPVTLESGTFSGIPRAKP